MPGVHMERWLPDVAGMLMSPRHYWKLWPLADALCGYAYPPCTLPNEKDRRTWNLVPRGHVLCPAVSLQGLLLAAQYEASYKGECSESPMSPATNWETEALIWQMPQFIHPSVFLFLLNYNELRHTPWIDMAVGRFLLIYFFSEGHS